MPPEATNSPALPPLLPSYHSKTTEAVMITKTRLVHMLVLVLAFMSIFRLLRLAITTLPYSPVPSLLTSNADASNPFSTNETVSSPTPTLTIKEFKFLTDLISQKAPCNLLIFGLEPEYLILSEINSQGTTIILEDNLRKLRLLLGRPSNNTSIHKVEYPIPAKEAYKVLKQARKKASCWPQLAPLEESKCGLALRGPPKEVYRHRWDVIIVDGPSGDRPDAPGRMSVIYSASVLARAGNSTNVVVHDVDRVIEKWFSWEFLCEDNLVSTRGKFWNFLLESGSGGNHSNSTSFCSPKAG